MVLSEVFSKFPLSVYANSRILPTRAIPKNLTTFTIHYLKFIVKYNVIQPEEPFSTLNKSQTDI